eukprot:TRINITY_DN2497_c1_g1_i1.p1 TRINITY_DN2497_c1_g1~~TRINITY_DN2497_c1_g1_i1.p1  ORF type:complete len:326 (+),score=82.18 TRINITY_DN2497_c1_g1_i1:37-1014(+)
MEEVLLKSGLLPSQSRARVREFVISLKRRDTIGSYPVAVETAQVLRDVLSHHKWENTRKAIDTVKLVGRILMDARPVELGIGNVVRRVLYFLRESYFHMRTIELSTTDAPADPSGALEASSVVTAPALTNLLGAQDDEEDYSLAYDIKTSVLEEINEFLEELKAIYSNVRLQALDHIHASEVIMTYGASVTVEAFLSEVARKGRNFQVIVAEGAPTLRGRHMAACLAKAGIDTTLISDSAVFAMMGRVNKVIIGTHGVLANGGLVAPAGIHTMAQAAKFHSVPVVVCAGLYKLAPLYPRHQDSFNELSSPSELLNFEEGSHRTHY